MMRRDTTNYTVSTYFSFTFVFDLLLDENKIQEASYADKISFASLLEPVSLATHLLSRKIPLQDKQIVRWYSNV